jgi:hypothetical protein
MKSFAATTNIHAPAARVWSILTDAPNYPRWDPGVIRIEGKIAPGEKITAYTKLSPNRAFPAKVTEFVPGQRMVWSGGMPLGLFKGERTFTLAPRPDGTLDFTLREVFTGPLLPLMAGSLPDLTATFEAFAAGLKAYAERI